MVKNWVRTVTALGPLLTFATGANAQPRPQNPAPEVPVTMTSEDARRLAIEAEVASIRTVGKLGDERDAWLQEKQRTLQEFEDYERVQQKNIVAGEDLLRQAVSSLFKSEDPAAAIEAACNTRQPILTRDAEGQPVIYKVTNQNGGVSVETIAPGMPFGETASSTESVQETCRGASRRAAAPRTR